LDRILLCEVAFRGYHGVSPEEQTVGGQYTVDVEIEADLSRAGRTDRVEDTIDYGVVHRIVRQIGEGEPYRLLEALADRLATALLDLQGVQCVRLTVRKHHPPLPGIVAYAAVTIERRA